MRSIPLATLLLLSCAGPWTGGSSASGGRGPAALSYAQVQSLRTEMPLPEVERMFGPAADRKTLDGKTRALAYAAENEQGEILELRIGFDDTGRVTRWTHAPRESK